MTDHRPDGLALPADARMGPNCGVTAVAIVAGVSFAEAFAMLRGSKSARWKGRTTESERLAVLARLGVTLSRIHVRRMTLATLARRLDPTRRYIVRTTGHVQVLQGGQMIDQCGPRPVMGPVSRKIVTSVLRVDGLEGSL